VRFGPTAAGLWQTTLAFTGDSNDPTSGLQVQIQGTGGSLPSGPKGGQGAPGETERRVQPRARRTRTSWPAGIPGQVRLVTRKAGKVKGRRVKRRRCTSRLVTRAKRR
jgi:hypothetical protein